ncbi:competence type IV pilus minor pilin ComGD [Oceanobacillus bengalensis]|uniref:competence type IV pilus minor pilin ComGD n=1 Tax=Oceanobacillus bengalensis TaxID=1435466 RepID=UPI00160387A8|nr:competence type IV pilus minor pilin ComGD [Oceanobacillus bengalensis]
MSTIIKVRNGFTLVEVLFVLTILSILLLFTPKPNLTSLNNIHVQQFFKVLQSDVLYAQTLTPTSKYNIRIRFYADKYVVYDDNIILETRNYPKGLSVDTRTNDTFEFSNAGTIKNPRAIIFATKDVEYRIVFPFGKGRFYIHEN